MRIKGIIALMLPALIGCCTEDSKTDHLVPRIFLVYPSSDSHVYAGESFNLQFSTSDNDIVSSYAAYTVDKDGVEGNLASAQVNEQSAEINCSMQAPSTGDFTVKISVTDNSANTAFYDLKLTPILSKNN